MSGVEKYFSRVISGLLTSCLKVEQAYQLSLSSLYCIAKMLENLSLESFQESAELVQTVKTYLPDESEDHRAAALYLFSFFTSQIDLEVIITAILLSSEDHDKTREASLQLLTNLAEVRPGDLPPSLSLRSTLFLFSGQKFCQAAGIPEVRHRGRNVVDY